MGVALSTCITSTGPTEHCLSYHPSHVVHRSHRQQANVVFTVATVSVVWFTNTSWRRDQVLAPYRPRAGLVDAGSCGRALCARARRRDDAGDAL